MLRISALTLLLALAAGCQASQPELPPVEPMHMLETGTPLEVEYESVVTYAGGFELPKDLFEAHDAQPEDEAFEIAVQLVSLPSEVAEQLFTEAPRVLGGWRVERTEADDVLANLIGAGAATSLNDAMLSLYDGQAGWITLLNQTAYISGFEIEKASNALMADPVVSVLNDGIVTRIRPTRSADGTLQLDLELEMMAVDQPIGTSEATIPGSAYPVTLQLPVASRQQLRSVFPLASDECAVLSGLGGPDPEARILAFISAQPLQGGAVPSARQAGR